MTETRHTVPVPSEWWTTDKRGESQAHLVAVVIPPLGMTNYADVVTLWSPACEVANQPGRNWYSAGYSTFKAGPCDALPPHRCMFCESHVSEMQDVFWDVGYQCSDTGACDGGGSH